MAARLYHALREADCMGEKVILCETVKPAGVGLAVMMNRLLRAPSSAWWTEADISQKRAQGYAFKPPWAHANGRPPRAPILGVPAWTGCFVRARPSTARCDGRRR